MLSDAIVAPIVAVPIEVTDHLVEWDATIGMSKAHDLEATKQSDVVLCREPPVEPVRPR